MVVLFGEGCCGGVESALEECGEKLIEFGDGTSFVDPMGMLEIVGTFSLDKFKSSCPLGELDTTEALFMSSSFPDLGVFP